MTAISNVIKDKKSDATNYDKIVKVLNLKAVIRDGSITPFKSEKISNAIKKAFLAQTKIRNNQEQNDQLKENIESINISLNENIISDINLVHENNPNPAP